MSYKQVFYNTATLALIQKAEQLLVNNADTQQTIADGRIFGHGQLTVQRSMHLNGWQQFYPDMNGLGYLTLFCSTKTDYRWYRIVASQLHYELRLYDYYGSTIFSSDLVDAVHSENGERARKYLQAHIDNQRIEQLINAPILTPAALA